MTEGSCTLLRLPAIFAIHADLFFRLKTVFVKVQSLSNGVNVLDSQELKKAEINKKSCF
jgi:hypothetical protein